MEIRFINVWRILGEKYSIISVWRDFVAKGLVTNGFNLFKHRSIIYCLFMGFRLAKISI